MGLLSDKVGEAKAWFESITIIGVLLAFIPTIVQAIEPSWVLDLSGAADEIFTGAESLAATGDQMWATIVELLGSAIAIWGRIKAKVVIK